jgi:hypothetical protein
VREHNKYAVQATCGDLQYVHSKFEDTPSIDKRTFNHARSRTRALERVRVVREHDNCVDHVACGYCSVCSANLKRIRPKISECLTTRALAHTRSYNCYHIDEDKQR